MFDDKSTEREINIYKQYQDIIAPFIAELEVRDTEYPIEIFNEVRSIFTHLSRYKIQKQAKDLISAESHVKRAILDCFKYMCISMAEEINDFRNSYKKVDLKLADNGKFLPELDRLEHIAKKSYKTAKVSEIKKEISDDELYVLFETAYNNYKTLLDFLESSEEAILFASSHSKNSNMVNIISILVTTISILIAVVSILL